MYLQFDILHSDVDFDQLEHSVASWAEMHSVPFSTKLAKGLKYRLGLNCPEHYTLFFMTWNGAPYEVKNTDKT